MFGGAGNAAGGLVSSSWDYDSPGQMYNGTIGAAGAAGNMAGSSAYQGLFDSASGMVYGAGPYGGTYTPQPRQQSGGMGGILGLLMGGASTALSFFLNRDKRDPQTPTTFQDSIALVPEVPEIEYPVFPDYGGAKDKAVPHLTGISNNNQRYQPDPRVYGHYRYFPPIAASVLTEIRGEDQYLTALLCLGYGELDISEIKIGDKLITEYEDVQYEIRYGTPTDDPITLYTQDIEEENIDTLLLYNQAVTKTAGQSANKLSVDIMFPEGLITTTTNQNGQQVPASASVSVTVQYRLAGSSDPWVSAGTITATDTTNSIVRNNLTWNVTRALYEIKLTRTTSNYDQNTSRDKCNWSVLRAFDASTQAINPRKDINGNIKGTAWLALSVKATEEMNGTVQTVSVLGKSKLLVWNGSSWALQITNNPAWIMADMLCGNWLTRPISRSRLDIDSFVAFADYCDAKGFTFNYVYDQKTTLWEALKQVCAVGRASPARLNGGKWGIVIDNEKTTPSQFITPSNSWNFEASFQIPDFPDAVNVRFVNPEANYTQDERAVYADGKDASNANKRETLTVIGVSDKDHAWKIGRYYIAQGRLRIEKYYVSMDFENLCCRRGDLVYLNHDVPQFGIGSARIKSLYLNESDDVIGIEIDNELPTTNATTYDLTIRLANNVKMSRQVVGDGLTKAHFFFTQPIPAATAVKPQEGDIILLGGYVQCVIEHIEYQAGLGARLTLVDYAPGIFTSDTGTIPPHDSQITIVEPIQKVIAAPIIDRITSNEDVLLERSDGSLETRVLVEVQPVPLEVWHYQYEFRLTGSQKWGKTNSVPSGSGEIFVTGVQDGATVDIRIRNVTRTGSVSTWVPIDAHFVVGKTTLPPDVPVIDRQLDTIVWQYDEASLGRPRPKDWAGFIIKADRSGYGNWAAGEVVEPLTKAFSIPRNKLPAGTFSFMIVAVDTVGNESLNPAILQVDFGDPEIANVIATETDSPTFTAGTITNGTVSGGELLADDSGGLFWTDDNAPFWSGNDSDLFWKISYLPMTYERTFIADTTSQVPMQLTQDIEFEAEGIQISYRRKGSSLFWEVSPGADDQPFWTDDDAPFWDADPPFILWPGSILVNQQEQIDFKYVFAASSLVRGKLSHLAYNLDVPDLVEDLENIVISAAGTRLPITKQYRQIQGVQITVLHDPLYPDVATAVVFDKDTSGPLLKLKDAGGTFINGLVDARIKGVAA